MLYLGKDVCEVGWGDHLAGNFKFDANINEKSLSLGGKLKCEFSFFKFFKNNI